MWQFFSSIAQLEWDIILYILPLMPFLWAIWMATLDQVGDGCWLLTRWAAATEGRFVGTGGGARSRAVIKRIKLCIFSFHLIRFSQTFQTECISILKSMDTYCVKLWDVQLYRWFNFHLLFPFSFGQFLKLRWIWCWIIIACSPTFCLCCVIPKGRTDTAANKGEPDPGGVSILWQHQVRHLWDWGVSAVCSGLRLGAVVSIPQPTKVLVEPTQPHRPYQVMQELLCSNSHRVHPLWDLVNNSLLLWDSICINKIVHEHTVRKAAHMADVTPHLDGPASSQPKTSCPPSQTDLISKMENLIQGVETSVMSLWCL